MYRKIYKELNEWKSNKSAMPLIVLGVRQCGKTYIIDKFCQNEYQNYRYINLLEHDDIIELYDLKLSSDEKYSRLKALINFDPEAQDSVLFIDEIQESENLIAELKYFQERHPAANIICAGSLLGVKLKRSKKSFPVGKVKFLRLYPLDFEEFLMALEENILLDTIKSCFEKNNQMTPPLHDKAMNLYRKYLITGGMPASIKNFIDVKGDYLYYDETILKDITESYFDDMNKYITSDAESLKIKKTYQSLPSQLSNASHKFQFSHISKEARKREYTTPLDWLEASSMISITYNVKLPAVPLEGFVDYDTYKIFLSDVGILNSLLGIKMKDIITDNLSLYKGIVAENFVANQLVANGNKLYYWLNDNYSEIDFLYYSDEGIIPIEVKAADNTQSKSLKTFIDKYDPKYAIRISSKDFGYNPETKIKSIPLYATYLLKNNK